VDSTFLSQSRINCNLGYPIPIESNEIPESFSIIKIAVDKIEKEFDNIINPEIEVRINNFENEKFN
jgi:hypothetical protein